MARPGSHDRKPRWDVVVVGGANSDFLARGPHLPRPGESVQGSEFLSTDAGGKGANQAVAAARLGARTAFIGCIGADARGEALVQALRSEQVDVRHVFRDARAPTGAALVLVDEAGEKQIIAAPGATRRLTVAQIKQAAPLLRATRVLLLQFEVPIAASVAAARIARAAGALVVLDPAPAAQPPETLLRLVDIIRPNEHEAEALTGVRVRDRKSARQAAERLLDHGIRAAVVAAGSGGNLAVWRENDDENFSERWLPKVPVKTVDATGAGDAFAGALAVALASDCPIADAVTFANAAAALATTKLGAQTALPTRDAVRRILRRMGEQRLAQLFT